MNGNLKHPYMIEMESFLIDIRKEVVKVYDEVLAFPRKVGELPPDLPKDHADILALEAEMTVAKKRLAELDELFKINLDAYRVKLASVGITLDDQPTTLK